MPHFRSIEKVLNVKYSYKVRKWHKTRASKFISGISGQRVKVVVVQDMQKLMTLFVNAPYVWFVKSIYFNIRQRTYRSNISEWPESPSPWELSQA